MNLFNPPTATTVRDINTTLTTANNDILLVVSQTKDETGTKPVDDDSDNEDIPIASDSKSSEHDDIYQQLNVAIDRTDNTLLLSS